MSFINLRIKRKKNHSESTQTPYMYALIFVNLQKYNSIYVVFQSAKKTKKKTRKSTTFFFFYFRGK